MHVGYKFKLNPSKKQHALLHAALSHSRDLYNSALEEKISAWKKFNKNISKYDQFLSITELRSSKEWSVFPVTLQRWPIQQVDLAFKNFFRRIISKKIKSGFPRFKNVKRFKTFGFTQKLGWKIEDKRLYIKGIGFLKISIHRKMLGEIRDLKIKREGRNWYALIGIRVEPSDKRDGEAVGLDMGLTHLATKSDGFRIKNLRTGKKSSKSVRVAQRALARAKRGSKRRVKTKEKLARLRRHEANCRKTYLHQVSAKITRDYATICVENLDIKQMVSKKSGSNDGIKHGLNRNIHDASWGRFIFYLTYKAERAGGRVIKIDPRYTSQMCSDCGIIKPKPLWLRTHTCECGLILDRDHNAALNILHRGVVVPDVAKLACLPV